MKLPFTLLLFLDLILSLGTCLRAAAADEARSNPAPLPTTAGVDPAILTVDLKKIFESHPKTIEAEKRINDQRNQSKNDPSDEFTNKEVRLISEFIKLDASLKSGELQGERLGEARKLRDEKQAELKAFNDEIGKTRAARAAARAKELEAKTVKLRAEIIDDIMKAIAATPAVGETAFLLDKSGPSLNGVPLVIYSNPKLDRTDAVLKHIGVIKAPEEPGNAALGKALTIAIVDMKRIFAGYYKTREGEEKINDARKAAKKEYEERLAREKAAVDQIKSLDAQLAAAGLSEPDRTAKMQERATKQAAMPAVDGELREFQMSREKQLQEQAVQTRNALVNDINQVIAEGVKADGGVDLIFDSSGPGLNGIPILLRHEGIPEWTESAITALNSSKAGGQKSSMKPAAGPVSTSGLRFAVIDLKRVYETLPLANAAKLAIEDAHAKSEGASEAERKVKDKELQDRSVRMRAEIVGKITAALSSRASEAGCHMVFDSSAPSLNGVPVVILHGAAPDLSSEIIVELGSAAR